MKKYLLFLDDERMPSQVYLYTKNEIYNDTWVIARNFDDFVKIVSYYGIPGVVSFDHDLADIKYNPQTQQESFEYHEKTGYDCAKWLVEYCMEKEIELPQCLVHSQNPVGKENIEKYIEFFKIG